MTHCRAQTVLPLLMLLAAAPASAQDIGRTESLQSDATAPVAEAAKQEAARRFEHAIKLYEDTDYTLALAEFERVYELMPDYRVLYNIGQVSIQLGRYARAYRTLKEYVARGGSELPADRARAVEADLSSLSGKIASVSVDVTPAGAEIWVDGTVVGTAPLAERLVVDVGEHRLEARLGGYVPGSRSITLAGGDRRELSFRLEPEAPKSAQPPTPPTAAPTPVMRAQPTRAPFEGTRSWTWLGWASTGVLATGALVTGALGASAASDLRGLRTTAGTSRRELDQARGRASSRLVVADILGGAALVTGGVTLYLQLSRSPAKDKAMRRSPFRLALAPNHVALVFER